MAVITSSHYLRNFTVIIIDADQVFCPTPIERDNLTYHLVLTVMNGDLSHLRVYRGRNLIASLISVRFLGVGKINLITIAGFS